jgi:hypothetical protein
MMQTWVAQVINLLALVDANLPAMADDGIIRANLVKAVVKR